MNIVTKDIAFETKGNCDIVDITSQVVKEVAEEKEAVERDEAGE